MTDIDYPFHDKVIVVTNCGRICLGQKKINFSTVLARRSASKKFTTISGSSASGLDPLTIGGQCRTRTCDLLLVRIDCTRNQPLS